MILPTAQAVSKNMKQFRRVLSGLILGLWFVSISGCKTTTAQHTAALSSTTSAVQQRSIDSRRFETSNEKMMLNSVIALMQDLGFAIEETEADAGVISGLRTGQNDGQFRNWQKVRLTVTTRPLSADQIAVRVSFQGQHWNAFNRQQTTLIKDPRVYQVFFDKLSQAIFLEAHEL